MKRKCNNDCNLCQYESEINEVAGGLHTVYALGLSITPDLRSRFIMLWGYRPHPTISINSCAVDHTEAEALERHGSGCGVRAKNLCSLHRDHAADHMSAPNVIAWVVFMMLFTSVRSVDDVALSDCVTAAAVKGDLKTHA